MSFFDLKKKVVIYMIDCHHIQKLIIHCAPDVYVLVNIGHQEKKKGFSIANFHCCDLAVKLTVQYCPV